MFCRCPEIREGKAKFLITIVCDDQMNKARLVITRASEAGVLITTGEGGKVFFIRLLISR
jgi:hypothetical protein